MRERTTGTGIAGDRHALSGSPVNCRACCGRNETCRNHVEDHPMHTPNCNCPRCRAAADGYGTELFEFGELGGELTEQEELELAMELLSAQNEQELEQFLGDVFRSVGSGLKSVGSFAMKN